MNVFKVKSKPITKRNVRLKDFSEVNRVSSELDTSIANVYGEELAFRGFGHGNVRERNLYISTNGFDAVLRACRGIKEIIIRREKSNVGEQLDLCELIINGWCGLYLSFNMVSIVEARDLMKELLSTTLNRFEYSVRTIESSSCFDFKEGDFDECFTFPIPQKRADDDQVSSVVHVYSDVNIDELRHRAFDFLKLRS
ncbi:hypothetical protein [Photobacterium sanguinicancri]|uniref:hypothetical protein n=1 Tax=Photobacterium sanguinicancri TaxID=875932 RepID=UPI0026E4080C|nr:hypothetical protein [Photobacterium sanguinicancri]MDO6500474.1 hypothetical protein [Photobacterium sanguinicancri]